MIWSIKLPLLTVYHISVIPWCCKDIYHQFMWYVIWMVYTTFVMHFSTSRVPSCYICHPPEDPPELTYGFQGVFLSECSETWHVDALLSIFCDIFLILNGLTDFFFKFPFNNTVLNNRKAENYIATSLQYTKLVNKLQRNQRK